MTSIASTVTITRIDDLINSMDKLSAELQRYNDDRTVKIQPNVQPQVPITQPVQQVAAPQTVPASVVQPPVTQPIPMQTASEPQQPATIPTSHVAQAYTVEQLQTAMATLVDAGKMVDVRALLSNFGVQSVMSLQPDQYGALATALRGMGAQI